MVILAASKWPSRLRRSTQPVYVTIWEMERVERDLAYVSSSMGVCSLEPNIGKQNACIFVLILYCDLILPLPYLSSLACNLFELAPKVIHIDWVTRDKKNYLLCSDFIITHSNTNLGWNLCSKFIISRFHLFTPLGDFQYRSEQKLPEGSLQAP
jgi:hypothetical protein